MHHIIIHTVALPYGNTVQLYHTWPYTVRNLMCHTVALRYPGSAMIQSVYCTTVQLCIFDGKKRYTVLYHHHGFTYHIIPHRRNRVAFSLLMVRFNIVHISLLFIFLSWQRGRHTYIICEKLAELLLPSCCSPYLGICLVALLFARIITAT